MRHFLHVSIAGVMENEELASLRATLLAAQKQPLAVKVRQARLERVAVRWRRALAVRPVVARVATRGDRTISARSNSLSCGFWKAASMYRGFRDCGACNCHEPMPTRPNRLAAVLGISDRAVPPQPDAGDAHDSLALGTFQRLRKPRDLSRHRPSRLRVESQSSRAPSSPWPDPATASHPSCCAAR